MVHRYKCVDAETARSTNSFDEQSYVLTAFIPIIYMTLS